MQQFFRKSFIVLLFFTFSVPLFSQNLFFTDAGYNTAFPTSGKREIFPEKYRASQLDVQQMKNFLWSLPSEEKISADRKNAPLLSLPMPDGSFAKFRVWESSLMPAPLASRFPEMKTFLGQGIDDPYATVRLDYNPYYGFSAQILSPNGRVWIDPFAKWDIQHYMSYYSRDAKREFPFVCDFKGSDNFEPETVTAGPCRGTQLNTYRLALACTGEYAIAVCSPNPPTVPATAAAMLTAVNRVTGVYETELSIRLTLIPNNDLLIYLDPNTDPYTNNNGSAMLGQNISNINAVIGFANYDIGHVFSTGGGGVAYLGVVCGTNKAGGVTGLPNPIGDAFYIDYVAHEMGHQFGGNHTFNSVTGSCSGNRSASSAYEVGSATTIMGYAGICGSDNIQPNSDPFFHTRSFDEISTYLTGTGGTCPVITSTGNSLPVITAMNNNGANIPLNTPFTLSASATDANGDPLTYCWEEWDLGPSGAWNSGATSTTAPLFKSRIPKTTGERTFPDMAVILAGYPSNPPATMGGLKGETLPLVGRAIKFRLTVRDNRAGGGGVVTGGDGCQSGFTSFFQVNTITGTGPFVVSAPNGGEVWQGGTTQTITWNPAGTDIAPISCTNVKISLSTDGGLTYPTVILASTPNDGSETVTIPATPSTTARIKIEAVGNIFFDISDADFTISLPAGGFTFTNPAPVSSSCPAPSTMSITLGTTATGGFSNPISLSASGNPPGTTVSFSVNPVTPGNSTIVTLNNTNTVSAGTYTVTITGTATGAQTQTRDLTFIINPGAGPTINTQPSPQTICAGSNASFSVAATGALSYQWQLSTDGGTNFTNITGANSSAYTINGVTAGMNNNRYRVIVIGQCNTTTSNAVILTVNTSPAITAQPVDVTVCNGSSTSFCVSATGTNLTYQWQISTNGCAGTWTNITGATSNCYNLTATGSAVYRCNISGTCPPSPVTTNCAALTVINPVTITAQPASTEICSGSNTSFSVSGNSTQTISYQWQVNTGSGFTNINNGGVYSNATTATLNITGATAAMNTYQYRCLLSNTTCTAPVNSATATLTVRQLPTVGLAAAPLSSLLPGQTTTLTATPSVSTGGVLSTTWFFNTAAITNTGNTRVVNVEQIGNYQVRIQETWPSSLVCSNNSPIVTVDATASAKLFIFPNPNDGHFTVSYYNSGGAGSSRTITIYDSKGAKVYNAKFNITGLYTLLPVDMATKLRGIYHVVVGDANGDKIISGKVLIH
jgi:hypothetical protein